MAEPKTKPTTACVADFIASVDNPQMRADCKKIAAMMRRATGKRAKMWGPSIIGYGSYHYKYASGQEGDWMITGYSPRKQAITLYIMPGFSNYDALMKKLGKHKTGKSCLYINKLADVDEGVLETLITKSVEHMRKTYPTK